VGDIVNARDVTSVGVVGCGLMGSGIVEVCARAGCAVTYVESSEELVGAGRARIERSIAKALERGKIEAAEAEEVRGRIGGATDLGELGGADLVIEAATEDLESKVAVFRALDGIVRAEVVLASNTSSLPIVELAIATGRPDRVIGMHFFNPPPVMRLLEIIPAITTSEETLAFARAFGERVGKTAVVSKDHAGFIVNRMLCPFLNDAARLFDEGLATREDIDAAISLGLGHPMGPLTLMDLIGIDTVVHVADVLYREYGDARYMAPQVLRRMVASGRLGRKAGRGFYEYD
jgi:3-hydroxybutyryl-CoA dehydrogenase